MKITGTPLHVYGHEEKNYFVNQALYALHESQLLDPYNVVSGVCVSYF